MQSIVAALLSGSIVGCPAKAAQLMWGPQRCTVVEDVNVVGSLLIGKRQRVADAGAGGRVLAAEEPAPSYRCCVTCAGDLKSCRCCAVAQCTCIEEGCLTPDKEAGKSAPTLYAGSRCES